MLCHSNTKDDCAEERNSVGGGTEKWMQTSGWRTDLTAGVPVGFRDTGNGHLKMNLQQSASGKRGGVKVDNRLHQNLAFKEKRSLRRSFSIKVQLQEQVLIVFLTNGEKT